MSIGTNLLLIVVSFNLFLVIFGSPSSCSPVLSMVSAWLTGANPVSVIIEYGNALAIYLILMGILALASFSTGANYLTTGGGHGAVMALQILGISIFSALLLFPNFSTLGFPTTIEYILNIVFGSLLTAAVVEILRGR